MTTENGKQATPAYIAWSFLLNLTNGLRQSGMPLQIDRYVMPTASGSQVSAAVSSLKYLKWLDSNSKPTEEFKQFVKASDEERPALLRKTLEAAYPFLFEDPDFHLERATGQMMAEKFRKFGLQGATLSKAVGFFLAAAKPAGIAISQHIKPPPMPVSKGAKRTLKKKGEEFEDDDALVEEDEVAPDVQRFQIPIPGKPSAVFTIPTDLEDDDWEMLKTMLDAYIARMRKQQSLV